MTKKKPTYVSTNITVKAREVLTSATLRASADVGRRLPQSAVLIAALQVAQERPEEFVRKLEDQEEGKE